MPLNNLPVVKSFKMAWDKQNAKRLIPERDVNSHQSKKKESSRETTAKSPHVY